MGLFSSITKAFYNNKFSKVHESITGGNAEKALGVLNKSESIRHQYIDWVISLSDRYIAEGNPENAINTLDENIRILPESILFGTKAHIIHKHLQCKEREKINMLIPLTGKHEDIEPIIAQLYLKQGLGEQGLDRKRMLLEKSYSCQNNHRVPFNKDLYKPTFEKAMQELHSLAKEYSKIGYYDNAYEVLSLLYGYDSTFKFISTFCEIKIVESRNLNLYNQKVSLLEEAVEFTQNKACRNDATTEGILLEILLIAEDEANKTTNNDKKNQILTKAYTFVEKHTCGLQSVKKNLDIMKDCIVFLLFEKGKKLEKGKNLKEALQIYDSLSKQSGENFDVEVRKCICFLKDKQTLSEGQHVKIKSLLLSKSNSATQDLAYRYALYMLKNGNHFDEANNIIKKYLPLSEKSLQVRQFCKNESIKVALSKLQNFNQKLLLINSNGLSIKDANSLLALLDDLETSLTKELPDLRGSFLSQKESIHNYILKRLFETEDYLSVIDTFFSSDDSYYQLNTLHNIAIAALEVAKTGKLNRNNYEKIISIWITAIHQDILFVKSLAHTSWDDQYNFTLYDSLGKIDEGKDMPDNVNYEDPICGRVSIGEVQKQLLNEFKNVITDASLYNSSQISIFEEFYEKEMDAITALFSLNLEKQCFHTAPYCAGSNKSIMGEIKDSLENKFRYSEEEVDYEKVLEVGITYGITTKRYTDYQSAKAISNNLLSAVENLKRAVISSQFISNNISSIKKYPKLFNNLSLQIKTILDNQIKSNTSFQKIYEAYIIISKQIDDSNLWFSFINYLLNDTVKNVNNHSLSNLNALSRLYDVYCNYPNHQRLCDNMVTLCDMLIEEEIMSDGCNSSNAKQLLDKIIANRNTTFKTSARKLSNKYYEILNQLDPINRVLMTGSSNYSVGGTSLNAKGLALKKSLNYFKNLSH